jgi:hypothetical protein
MKRNKSLPKRRSYQGRKVPNIATEAGEGLAGIICLYPSSLGFSRKATKQLLLFK